MSCKFEKGKRSGVSLIALVITIIVLIILALVSIGTSSRLPSQATYSRFAQEITNVQSGVYDTRIKNSSAGDSEEVINAGFRKVALLNAPGDFESFDFTGASTTGYLIGLDVIGYENAEFGKAYAKEKDPVKFGEDDVYVYDATGTVYYVKGLKYDGGSVHTLAEARAIESSSNEEGPIISNVVVESGELDNGQKTNARAKIIISAQPRKGGKLTVMVRNNIAVLQPNGTYATQVSRNGTYTIIVTEENGGRTTAKVTVSGLIESTEPPSNLQIVINNGDEFTTNRMADVVVRADGATKMLINKNNPIRPSRTEGNWEEYRTNFEYDLGPTEGKVTLYAWFIDEFDNITENIVRDSIVYDETAPSMEKPTLVPSGPYVIVTSNQKDNVSTDEYIKSTTQYGYKESNGTPGTEDSYTWGSSNLIGPLSNGKKYEFVTKATDEAGNSSMSEAGSCDISFDYTINFDLQGGEGNFETVYTKADTAIILPAETPVKTGYDFVGWSENPETLPGDSANLIGPLESYTPVGDVAVRTLYAIYNARNDTPYKVYHYVEKIGAANEYEVKLVEELKGITDKEVFANAKTTGDFVGLVENKSHPDRVVMATLKADGSTELKLFYQRTKYKLTLKAINGTVSDSLIEVPYETEVSISAIGNSGYVFERWVIDEAGTSSMDYQNFVNENGPLSENAIFKMPGRNITLVAHYKLKPYYIKYELNGGTLAEENPTEYSKESEPFTLNNPSKPGYNFIGWTGTDLLEPTKVVRIDPSTLTVFVDRTYTANYEPAENLLTLSATPTTPTRGSVKVSINCLDTSLRVEYQISAGNSWNMYSSPVDVTSNCTVYARAMKDGVIIAEKSLVVDNIDKESPVIEDIYISENWEIGTPLKLTLKVKDDLGLGSYAVSTNEMEPDPSVFNTFVSDIDIIQSGLNYIFIKDLAGNSTSIAIYAWDISKNQDQCVYAFLKNEKNMIIAGRGETTSYEEGASVYESHKNFVETIEIKDGVTGINDYILSDMERAKTISIPASLTKISDNAFVRTNNYSSISVDSANKNFVYDKYSLYNKQKTAIYLHSRLDENQTYELENTVTEIKKYAFYENDNLKKVTVKANPIVGESAFEGSNNLLEIEGEVGGTRIGKRAFVNCTSLEIIRLSNTLKVIEPQAFAYTSNLGLLTIPKTVEQVGNENSTQSGVFSDIGKNSGGVDNKGTVRYYQSSKNMHVYATNFASEANFVMIDDIPAELFKFGITSPESGSYAAGEIITFVAEFNEKLNEELTTTLPTLTIKIGDGANKVVTNGTIDDKKLIYTYVVSEEDEGVLQLVSLVGSVFDMSSNETKVSCTEMTGSKISVRTAVKLEENAKVLYFAKLQDAIDTSALRPEVASVITLLKDIEESAIIPQNKKIKLDLNNKTLTAESQKAAITNNSSLEILGNGVIKATDSNAIINKNLGSLNLNNVQIEDTSNTYSAIVFEVSTSGTFTNVNINAEKTAVESFGRLEIIDSTISSNSNSTIIGKESSVTSINKGTIKSESTSPQSVVIEVMRNAVVKIDSVNINTENAIAISNQGTIDINGSTEISANQIIINNGTIRVYDGKFDSNTTGETAMINRGEFDIYSGDFIADFKAMLINEAGTTNIKGGSLSVVDGTYETISNSYGAELVISKAVIANRNNEAILNNGTLVIEPDSLISSNGNTYTITNESSGKLNLNGGTISLNNNAGIAALENKGNVITTGGTITSNGNYGIRNTDSGRIEADGLTINTNRTAGDSIGISQEAAFTVTLKNTNITTASQNGSSIGIQGVANSIILQKITINSTSTTGKGYGIKNVNSEIIVGILDQNIEQEMNVIEGSDYGYYSETGKLNFYDGKFIGKVNQSIVGDITQKVEESFIKKIIEGTRETSILMIDKDAPINVNLQISTTDWTNKAVTLSGEATDNNSGIIAYAFNKYADTPAEWTYLDAPQEHVEITKIVEEYTNMYFHVMDYAGNTAVSNMVTVKYDNEPPEITGISLLSTEWSRDHADIVISAKDKASGIAGYEITTVEHALDEIEGHYISIPPTNDFTRTFRVTNNIYFIYLIDQVGNVKFTSYPIYTIDNIAPTIKIDVVKYLEDETLISVSAKDEESGIDKITVNGEELKIFESRTKRNTYSGDYSITKVEKILIEASDKVSNVTTFETESYGISYNSNLVGRPVLNRFKLKDENINILGNLFEEEGFEFLNWNTSPDGKGTTYNSGDLYTKNESVVLYAMQNDIESPKIIDISLSPEWNAGEDVIVRVTASDNLAVTEYAMTTSLTDTPSWQESTDFTIPKDGKYYIWVRDAKGNISNSEFSVYDISKEAGSKEAIALIKGNNHNAKELNIGGVGATADFTLENMPWSDQLEEIEYVVVSDGITGLGSNVLANLESAKEIVITETVTDIAIDAFVHTNKYESLVIDGNNFVAQQGMLYSADGTKLYVTSGKMIPDYVVIAGTVEEIGPYALEDSTATEVVLLQNIDIPDGFAKGADKLVHIVSDNGVGGKYIGESAFEGCTLLETLEVSMELETLGKRAFYDCYNLTDITMGPNIKDITGVDTFTHIGRDTDEEQHKGKVYYYESSTEMTAYATGTNTKDEAIFIPIDNVPPVVQKVLINSGDLSTPAIDVVINVKATDNHEVIGIYITEESTYVPKTFEDTPWIDYVEEEQYEYSFAEHVNGLKTIYVWAIDGSGNISVKPGVATIRLVEDVFHLKGQEEVIQYVDKTGKDYYEYRDLGYTLKGTNYGVRAEINVDHNNVGRYVINYILTYDGEDIGTYTRDVNIIENSWGEERFSTDSYEYVLHTKESYAKIVGFTNDAGMADIVFPEIIEHNGEEYKVIDFGDGTNSITKNETNVMSIELPSTTIAVSDYAFSEYTKLNNIIYNNALMTIGKYAFSNNYDGLNDSSRVPAFDGVEIKSNVREVKENAFRGVTINHLGIEEGVKSIEAYAFYETIGSVTDTLDIPASVEEIGVAAFGGRSVSEITVSEENKNYKDINDKELLTKDGTKLLLYAGRDTSKTYNVPEGVVTIDIAAVSRATSLEKFILADATKEIKYAAFRNSKTIQTVENTDNLNSIEEYAFYLSGLQTIEIPSGVTEIKRSTFERTKLTDIYLHENMETIEENAYANIDTLKSAVFAGDTTIDKAAFNNSKIKYLVMMNAIDKTSISGDMLTIPDTLILYTTTKAMEAVYEADEKWGTLGPNRIKYYAELVGSDLIELEYGESYVETGIRMFDDLFSNGNGDSAKVKGFSVSRTSNVNTKSVGEYEVKYTITYRNEIITEIIRTVRVKDTEPPVIQDIQKAESWVPGTDFKVTVTATDNYDTELDYALTSSEDYSDATWSKDNEMTLSEGKNYIHVKDSSGNVTTTVVEVWDISENEDKKVFAFKKEDGELVITGEGATKGVEKGNAPWKEEADSITGIVVEEGVTKLGDYILSDLPNANDIEIPSTLTDMSYEHNPFAGTNNFDHFEVAEGNPAFKMTDDYTLRSVDESVIVLHSRKDPETDYVMDEKVKEVAGHAFSNNHNIESLTLSGPVDLDENAFENCENLKDIEGSIGGPKIGSQAFKGDVSLSGAVVSEDVTELGTGIFEDVPGPIYYYASCEAMREYAEKYADETEFVMIDNKAPSDDAPELKASSSTIVVTPKQKDTEPAPLLFEYLIRAEGEDYDETKWQSNNYFTGLTAETTYYVKTRATDSGKNTTVSEESHIKTEKVPDQIDIKAMPEEPTKGNVQVIIEWPETEIDRLYGEGWPEGTTVIKQIGIKKGTEDTNWDYTVDQEANSQEVEVSENGTTVFARLWDGTNYTVQTISLTVENIDREAPTGSVVINNDDATTLSEYVKLKLTAKDNFEERGYPVKYYYASESAETPADNLKDTEWQLYSGDGEYDYVLSMAREEKTVYVWFMDIAGNVSDAYSDSITLLPSAVRLEQNNITTYYDTLTEAVDVAVKTTPQIASKITLLKHIAGEKQIVIEETQNIVLDMNGYNIMFSDNASTFGFKNLGKFKVINSNNENKTSITLTTTQGFAYGVYNFGLFDINGVSLTVSAPQGSAEAIRNVGPDADDDTVF